MASWYSRDHLLMTIINIKGRVCSSTYIRFSFMSFFFITQSFSLFLFFILFFNFTILYWFCHISTWIRHRYTCVPHPETFSLLPPCTVPLGRPSARAPPSIQYQCIEPGLVTHFIYDIIYVSKSFSQIIPPSPSRTKSKRLFYTSMSLLLSRIQGYCYHLSKFHT